MWDATPRAAAPPPGAHGSRSELSRRSHRPRHRTRTRPYGLIPKGREPDLVRLCLAKRQPHRVLGLSTTQRCRLIGGEAVAVHFSQYLLNDINLYCISSLPNIQWYSISFFLVSFITVITRFILF